MNTFPERECDVLIYDRKRAELTGIDDVLSFSDINVTLNSKYGNISIDGKSLKIISFDSSSGKLSITGDVEGVFYYGEPSEEKRSRRRLFS